MLSAEIARVQAKLTANLSAYDLYLRALAAVRERTESSISQALELLERAIASDPRFSAAYGFVASAHWNRLLFGWGSIADAKAPGFKAAKLAVELGKDDPYPSERACSVWSFPDSPIASSSKRRCARRDFQNHRLRVVHRHSLTHERGGPKGLPRRYPRREKRARRSRHSQGHREKGESGV
jgi:hypothetical protein